MYTKPGDDHIRKGAKDEATKIYAEKLRPLLRQVCRDPRQDRALLVLHYWQGLSIAECARELDVPEGTAKSRINRALGRLRERLEDGER